jgi:hypothetical protein
MTRQFGCYYPAPSGVYNFDQLETQLGRKFLWYSTFISLTSVPSTHGELTVAAQDHNLLVAYEPRRGVGLQFADILAGAYDLKLIAWFKFLYNLPCQVVIRWAHEMNGSWSAYSPAYTGAASSGCTSPQEFIDVWRYVVALQRFTTGATSNIRWFFCPSNADIGGYPMEAFYPGSDVVDVVGYDSYEGLNGVWNTPLRTMAGYTNMKAQATAYSRVSMLHRTAEIWIGEIGCIDASDPLDVTAVGASHSKGDFINAVFTMPMDSLPRLTTVNWFNAVGTRDWRFDSSPAALDATSKAMAKTS